MPIVLLLCAAALLLAACVQYLVCRFAKKKLLRALPPLLSAAVILAVLLVRFHGWSVEGEKAPVETLLFIPGLPAAVVIAGLFLGWRLWKRRWGPRVIDDKGRKR